MGKAILIMDKPALIVEMPELSTQTLIEIYSLMKSLMNTFETHYSDQLQSHYQSLDSSDWIPF